MNRLQLLLAGALLCALGIIAYANSFSVPFHFDDERHISENRYIRLTSFSAAGLWSAMIQDRKNNRPFSNLTFALNYCLHGERVWGYHLVNLMFHLGASAAIFFILLRTFCRAGLPEIRRDWAALVATAVWTVHPLQTQAVTYIVQRQTVMASAFTLFSLAAYLRGRESAQRSRRFFLYFLTSLFAIISIGSKEIGLITPLLLFLYEVYFFQKLSSAFLRRRAKTLILAAIILAALLLPYFRPEMQNKIFQGYKNCPFTPGQRLLTEPRVLFDYLSLILLPLPSRLSLEHAPVISSSLVHPWTTLPAILAWIAMLFAAIRFARQQPLLSFALLWYLGNLFLESSFLPLDLMNEHRLYLPSLALIVPMVAASVFKWPRLGVTLAGIGVLVLVLGAGTIARNKVWQNPPLLWRDALRKSDDRNRAWIGAWINLCVEENEAGRYHAALFACQRAIRNNPKIAHSYNSLGVAYFQLGNFPEARKAFEQAIALNPNMALAYLNLADVCIQEAKPEEALILLQRTLSLDASFSDAYLRLGEIYLSRHQPERAIPYLREYLRQKPKWIPAYSVLAFALLKAGDCVEAENTARQGLGLNPVRPELKMILQECSQPFPASTGDTGGLEIAPSPNPKNP